MPLLRVETSTTVDCMGRSYKKSHFIIRCDECWKEQEYTKQRRPRSELTFCSSKCRATSKKVQKKVDETNQKRYGGRGNGSLELREKGRETCLKTYGVDHPWKSDEVRDKQKKTMVELYGGENVFDSPVLMERVRETMVERHGVSHPMQVPELKEKMEQTTFERYGATCVLQAPEIKKEIERKWIEKYGGPSPFHSKEIQARLDHVEISRKGMETKKENGTIFSSKPELELVVWLRETFGGDDVLQQVWIDRTSIDVCVRSLKLYVQLDGVFYHCLIDEASKYPKVFKQADRDKRLDDWFRSQDELRLFRLTDLQWNEIVRASSHVVLLEQLRTAGRGVTYLDHSPGYDLRTKRDS